MRFTFAFYDYGVAGGLAAVRFFQHQGQAARSLLRRRARKHGQRLQTDAGYFSAGGAGQQLACFNRFLVGDSEKRTFSRFFYAFNRHRRKHVGTQCALVILYIA